jgi:mannosyltransferase PIG-V
MSAGLIEARPWTGSERTRSPCSPGRIVVQAWLASRGLILAVALVLAVVQHRSLSDMVSNWDVQHFAKLAADGYLADSDGTLMAFFPGWPVILALFSQLGVPVAISGVIISTACSAIAAAALYRLGGPWAAVAWLFAPTAVFTMVPYTESLFCALAFWAWERARADRWLAAALLTSAACTVRVSGLFLVGALLVMIITNAEPAKAKLRRTALMLLPAAVIMMFAIYLYALTGTWTAWYRAQSTGWVRQLTWPWDSFLNTIPAILPGAYANHPWWSAVFRGEMISMVAGVSVTIWCIVLSLRARKAVHPLSPSRGALSPSTRVLCPSKGAPSVLRQAQPTYWGEASWVGVQVVAFSMSYWFFSVNRATLLWFPLWIMLGRWVTSPGHSPRLHRVLVGCAFSLEIVLMLWWSWLFFTGHWAS